MKNFLTRQGIWILLIAVLVTVTMAALSAFGTGVATPIQNAANIVTSPFRSGAAAVTNWVDGRIRFADEFDTLKEENAKLKEENAALQEQVRQAQRDSEENALLRELLNLRPQQKDFRYESALVVDRTSSNWTRTLTLNKGASAGIAPRSCVINAEGYLVGVVTEVGTNWATVTTTVDTDFEMGAIVFRSARPPSPPGTLTSWAKGCCG